jgi:hypothetical protein
MERNSCLRDGLRLSRYLGSSADELLPSAGLGGRQARGCISSTRAPRGQGVGPWPYSMAGSPYGECGVRRVEDGKDQDISLQLTAKFTV